MSAEAEKVYAALLLLSAEDQSEILACFCGTCKEHTGPMDGCLCWNDD